MSQWVQEVSSIMGKSGIKIVVDRTLRMLGSLIAHADQDPATGQLTDRGQLMVQAADILVEDIANFDNGITLSLMASNLASKLTDGMISKSYRGTFGFHIKDATTAATGGLGDWVIAGAKKTPAELGLATNLNTPIQVGTDISLAPIHWRYTSVNWAAVKNAQLLNPERFMDRVKSGLEPLSIAVDKISEALKSLTAVENENSLHPGLNTPIDPETLKQIMLVVAEEERIRSDSTIIEVSSSDEALVEKYLSSWKSLELKLKTEGADEHLILQHQRWMIDAYASQIRGLEVNLQKTMIPTAARVTAGVLWWIYCATHEEEIEHAKDKAFSWVSEKTGMPKEQIAKIYESAIISVDIITLILSGSTQSAGKKLVKAVAQKVFRKEVPDELIQKAYDARDKRRELEEVYGKESVGSNTVPTQSAPNVKLAGKRHPQTGIVFDQRGFPIFDDIAKFDTRLPANIAKVRARDSHFFEATKQLKFALDSGQINKSTFDASQQKAISNLEKKIPGYTWHHHQEFGRLQLIPDVMHEKSGHIGGMSMWYGSET